MKNIAQKLFLTLDNLRVHHSPMVKVRTRNKNKAELFFLPSYSPERNPHEYLNSFLKYDFSDTPASNNLKQLKNSINKQMKMLYKNYDRIKKTFYAQRDRSFCLYRQLHKVIGA